MKTYTVEYYYQGGQEDIAADAVSIEEGFIMFHDDHARIIKMLNANGVVKVTLKPQTH